jgi:hypothetical protein
MRSLSQAGGHPRLRSYAWEGHSAQSDQQECPANLKILGKSGASFAFLSPPDASYDASLFYASDEIAGLLDDS